MCILNYHLGDFLQKIAFQVISLNLCLTETKTFFQSPFKNLKLSKEATEPANQKYFRKTSNKLVVAANLRSSGD